MADEAKTNWKPIIAGAVVVLLVLLCAYLVFKFLGNTGDGLNAKAPEIAKLLGSEKTACEDRVTMLHGKAIDGRAHYNKVRASANGTVMYLQSVVDDGRGNENAIKAELKKFEDESNAFGTWADQQANVIGANIGEIDLAAFAKDLLKMVDGQEQVRRKAVKDQLEKCKFRSWDEIVAGK